MGVGHAVGMQPSPAPQEQLTGLAGWTVDVMAALDEVGVGLLVALENLFPPLPSEVVLPLAGLLAQQGRMSLVGAVVAATVGSVAGALLLYEVGARLGRDRVVRLVDRMPLLDQTDLEDAEGWFGRHGAASVLFGRCLPGVRSSISVPAGVEGMPRGRFLLLTAVGSGVWNVLFIGLGYAVAGQVGDLGTLSTVLDVVLYVLLAVGVLLLARRLWRRRRQEQQAA